MAPQGEKKDMKISLTRTEGVRAPKVHTRLSRYICDIIGSVKIHDIDMVAFSEPQQMCLPLSWFYASIDARDQDGNPITIASRA
mgnify:CR=1 FL=1